jgi:hypothetical protein
MLSAKLWFLHQLQADQRLPAPVLEALKTEGRMERWGHGATIYHDPAQAELYMVLTGQVFVDDATPAASLMLRRGDLFGGASPHSATEASKTSTPLLKAFDETTLLAVDAERFRWQTSEYLGHFQARTRLFGNGELIEVPVMPLLGTPPASRLAHVLLVLLDQQGRIEGDRGVFATPLKPRALARLTGLDRQRVTLLLNLFREHQLIGLSGRDVVAPSLLALRGWALGDRLEL